MLLMENGISFFKNIQFFSLSNYLFIEHKQAAKELIIYSSEKKTPSSRSLSDIKKEDH